MYNKKSNYGVSLEVKNTSFHIVSEECKENASLIKTKPDEIKRENFYVHKNTKIDKGEEK